MKFVKADLKESQEDFHDIYVKQLQNSIRHIKESREMEERFMILEEMLRDERAAGRREGLQEGELNGQRAMLYWTVKLSYAFGYYSGTSPIFKSMSQRNLCLIRQYLSKKMQRNSIVF